ncbi:MAG: type IV pilin protein [Methylobacillus sp.]|nr:type IV pilin protein [Methylobacillus sp.]
MKNKNSGFTLIELMIALAVIGILAVLAWPSYRNHVIRGNRAAAQSQLMDLANREQHFLLAERAYTTVIGAGGLGAAIADDVGKFYTVGISLDCAVNDVPCYEIIATPIATEMQKDDGVLLIDSSGHKTRGGVASQWNR